MLKGWPFIRIAGQMVVDPIWQDAQFVADQHRIQEMLHLTMKLDGPKQCHGFIFISNSFISMGLTNVY